MKYGQGFWVVRDGIRLPDPRGCYAYPETRGFIYGDGDRRGEFLTEDFTVDYVPPEWKSLGKALRMTVAGCPQPRLLENAFDFDFASVPQAFHTMVCDKADHRIRVASLYHDLGYCVHDVLPFMTRAWWNRLLVEVMEAYCIDDGIVARMRDSVLRGEVAAGVAVGGSFFWAKAQAEIDAYRALARITTVPV